MINKLVLALFILLIAPICSKLGAVVLPVDSDSVKTDVRLGTVTVTAKTTTQKIKEGALNVNAIDVGSAVNRLNNINDLIGRSAGIRIRRDGGAGSDYDLSINGLSGNSIRYFIDGVPIDSKGSEFSLDNIPVNTVSRIEVFKGVVPSYLGADALGGAVNIVTKTRKTNFLDASYGYGSYHTQNADLNAQYYIPGTVIAIRPSFSIAASKNDYMMKEVRVWDEEEDQFIYADRRRFHDDYFSLFAGVDIGVNDVRWADDFFVTASFSKINKELQTGTTQEIVYGMAERRSRALNFGIRYSKRWLDKINTRMNLNHTLDKSETIDTAFRKYDWNGNYIPSGRNEINGRDRQWRVYERPLTVLSVGIDYDFNSSHSIALNYMLNRRENHRTDKVDKSFEPTNDVVTKHIISLTYNQSFFNQRFENTLFVKDYINATSINQSDYGTQTGYYDINPHAVKSYYGAGIGSKFNWIENLQFKASFEHSVRLPLSRELLGNGTTVVPNFALSPEQSNNLNIGIFGNLISSDYHTVNYEVNGFLRHVRNYIRASISEVDGLMQYRNEPAVHITGIDFDINYLWKSKLSVNVNGSYSDARDLRQFKTDGNPSATYKNRVPNRPWLFANAEVAYNFRNILKIDDNLRIAASYSYVHWYYLNWEAFGAVESKPRIPTQNVVNLSFTWSFLDSKYNISLDCDNIFDRIVYDNYRLQKPGRSFFAKFRIFLN